MDGTPSSPPPTSYGYLGAPSGKGVDGGSGQLLALPAFFTSLDTPPHPPLAFSLIRRKTPHPNLRRILELWREDIKEEDFSSRHSSSFIRTEEHREDVFLLS